MVVVGVASDGEAFLCKLCGQRLELVFGCGFVFGLGVVGLLFLGKVGWLRMFCWDCYVVKRMMG